MYVYIYIYIYNKFTEASHHNTLNITKNRWIYIYMVQNTYVFIIPRIGYEIIAQSSQNDT